MAYARPDVQVIIPLTVPVRTTVREAIERSGLLERFPEIDLKVNAVGIFSRRVKLETPLKKHDRVEIYRSLRMDPREARRRLAQAQRREKGKG